MEASSAVMDTMERPTTRNVVTSGAICSTNTRPEQRRQRRLVERLELALGEIHAGEAEQTRDHRRQRHGAHAHHVQVPEERAAPAQRGEQQQRRQQPEIQLPERSRGPPRGPPRDRWDFGLAGHARSFRLADGSGGLPRSRSACPVTTHGCRAKNAARGKTKARRGAGAAGGRSARAEQGTARDLAGPGAPVLASGAEDLPRARREMPPGGRELSGHRGRRGRAGLVRRGPASGRIIRNWSTSARWLTPASVRATAPGKWSKPSGPSAMIPSSRCTCWPARTRIGTRPPATTRPGGNNSLHARDAYQQALAQEPAPNSPPTPPPRPCCSTPARLTPPRRRGAWPSRAVPASSACTSIPTRATRTRRGRRSSAWRSWPRAR